MGILNKAFKIVLFSEENPGIKNLVGTNKTTAVNYKQYTFSQKTVKRHNYDIN